MWNDDEPPEAGFREPIASADDESFQPEAPFRAFYAHYGPAICGRPISGLIEEAGVPTQYFEHLALQERVPGQVSLKALGSVWLAERGAVDLLDEGALPASVDLRDRLSKHPSAEYPLRRLADIRYLVIHHTGAGPEFGPERIAVEHVEANGWPGIGYHYVIDTAGMVCQTQDATVVSHHVAQFNLAAIGIALVGDLSQASPAADQLRATAGLLARLCQDLGLPPSAIRGHGEIVGSRCPGERFLSEWKPALLREVERSLRPRPIQAPEPALADRLGSA
jgi:hypothetical protein